MDSPPPSLTFQVAVASLVVLATWLLWSFVESSFLTPWRIYRRLREQGIPGYPFRPIVGQLPDLIKVSCPSLASCLVLSCQLPDDIVVSCPS